MKKTNLYGIMLFSGMLFTATSCDNDSKEAETKEAVKEVVETTQADTLANNDEASVYTLPSPMQIATIFKKAGLKYYSQLTNPSENMSLYINGNTVTKTLGLGIYLSDLSYCLLNKQSQQSKQYFKTCSQLGESIGLGNAFQGNQVPSRLEKNMNNEDSVSTILADVQLESDNIMEENNQAYISVIAFSGAWIESMYIGTQVYMKEKHTNITANLVEQMGISENIIKALQSTKSKNADITNLLQDINALNDLYNNFKSVKEAKIADTDVIDATKLTITADELHNFSKKVEEIRARLIKG